MGRILSFYDSTVGRNFFRPACCTVQTKKSTLFSEESFGMSDADFNRL